MTMLVTSIIENDEVNKEIRLYETGTGAKFYRDKSVCLHLSSSMHYILPGLFETVLKTIAPSTGAVEYTDCFSAEG